MKKLNIALMSVAAAVGLLCADTHAQTPAAQPTPPASKPSGIMTTARGDIDLAKMSNEAQSEYFKRDRQSLIDDPYRPLYHFSPPGFGIHDPAGLCWWQGKYHLFYLFSVPGVQWGRGHAISDDLVHWQDLPMLPKEFKGGTGQVWADKDRAIMSRPFAMASDPLLMNWTAQPSNLGGDSSLMREGDTYYFINTVRGKNTAMQIHRSKDLAQWQTMGLLLNDSYYTEPGTDGSCPSLLSLGDGKHLVLFFSHNQGPKYYIGTMDFQTGKFAIEDHGRMNYGPVMRGSLHAPSGLVDPSGRCIGIWNVFEGLIKESFGGNLKGIISLPRRLSLNKQRTDNGRDPRGINPLCIEPIEELKALRTNPVKVANLVIPANGEKVLEEVRGRAMELEAIIDPRKAREVGLRVLRSANGEEQASISISMQAWAWPWTGDKRELMIDVSQASLSPDVASRTPEIGPLFLKDGELLHLRVFIDKSIIEVFANGRQCLTLRAYPTREDSVGVSVFARGSEAALVSLDAYQMKSIWPNKAKEEIK